MEDRSYEYIAVEELN